MEKLLDEQDLRMQVTIDLPEKVDQEYIKQALASVLYYNGVISGKQARLMIGKSRQEFEEEVIPKFRLSMIGGTKEDTEIERGACLR